MDALRDAINNVSLYEVKAAVRKAQNVVMNYTEMEAKVREATNNEPWGASSTLMNEISSATHNYQLLNEIMPMIYRRFTEKTAEEWRQIYKALQLLEFLVKNGSEQVIDDARSHLSTIKMLRQFYYIDQNGKDQGINVRNRAKELAELLSDVDRIRAERKKARQSKNKYGGVEGGSGGGGFSGHSNMGDNGFGRRYGGFGSDAGEFGGYSGGVFGDGGGFSSGGPSSGFHDDNGSRSHSRNQRFDEYDEYEDSGPAARRPASTRRQERAPPSKPPPPKKKEPEPDLLFGDDELAAPAAAPPKTQHRAKASTSALDDFGDLQSGGAAGADDDFSDFQTAAPPPVSKPAPVPTPAITSSASSVSLMQPMPVSQNQKSDINALVGLTSPPISAGSSAFASPIITPATTGSRPAMTSNTSATVQPNYFASVPASANNPAAAIGSQQKPKPKSDAFGNIWNQASSGIKKSTTPTQKTPSLSAMQKEKASAGIWGTTGTTSGTSTTTGSTGQKTGGSALDDLLG